MKRNRPRPKRRERTRRPSGIESGKPEVKAHHLRRRALVYLRQSTAGQVTDHPGSAANQHAQREHAVRFGWPQGAVIEIDDDLVSSGVSGEHRQGWRRLLKMVAAGDVGGIFVSDRTRLSRSVEDVEALLRLCKATETLLVIGGTVYDPNDPAARRWS